MKNKIAKRNIGIDLLRAAGILYIVGFWHMLEYAETNLNFNNYITSRITLIILGTFVFISGYFIGRIEVRLRKESLMAFYQKRLLRIYPLYLLAIILFTLLNLSNIATSLKAVFAISMLVKPAPPTLWFIAMLMLFYIASPIIIIACRKISIYRLVLYSTFLILSLVLYDYFTELLDARFLMYLPCFVLGVFAASNNSNTIIHKTHILFILPAILISFIKINNNSLDAALKTPMVLFCSYLLFGILRKIEVSPSRAYKIITLISYSSYCMYLFHRPVYMFLKTLYFPETYLLQIIYLAIFCLPCVIITSFVIQKMYDMMHTALTNKFSGYRRVAPLI